MSMKLSDTQRVSQFISESSPINNLSSVDLSHLPRISTAELPCLLRTEDKVRSPTVIRMGFQYNSDGIREAKLYERFEFPESVHQPSPGMFLPQCCQQAVSMTMFQHQPEETSRHR